MTLPQPLPSETTLLTALRAGDETAFATLFEKYHAALVRLATVYTNDRKVAEEVAQETWLGVFQGVHRFEGRSSLKTWIFTILINRAKTRGQRESRSLPFSALGEIDSDSDESAMDADRFTSAKDSAEWAGHWTQHPRHWDDLPETQTLTKEGGAHIRAAIAALPLVQRQVITLRDVDGFSAEEACNILEISETNQRVLLHRARSKVRRALEQYFDEGIK
jgi:RNA polymerase sigma-70 factor (ECF subfamily)